MSTHIFTCIVHERGSDIDAVFAISATSLEKCRYETWLAYVGNDEELRACYPSYQHMWDSGDFYMRIDEQKL